MPNFNNFKSEMEKVLSAATVGMEKATIQAEADTKALTHVLTGNLRRSWTHDVETNGAIVEGAVGTNVAYAQAEDKYHGNISTAFDRNNKKYFDTIYREIKAHTGG